MLNRQIKNMFDLLRTKTSKIEIKNLEHQNQHCKVVFEYTEGESALFRNYNSQNKWEKGIVQKKLGSLHYLIKYNNRQLIYIIKGWEYAYAIKNNGEELMIGLNLEKGDI